MTGPPEDAEPWQKEAWSHFDEVAAEFARNPFAQFEPLFDDLGFFPRGYGSRGGVSGGASGGFVGPIAWGQVSMDLGEFEATILATADEYERRLGVRPTVIDLPNWVRGTILEQIAFTNGFTIADRRNEQ